MIISLLVSLSCISIGKIEEPLKSTLLQEQKVGEQMDNMNTIFAKALKSRGQAYLDAEYLLRQGGKEALNILSQSKNHKDPVARLMVETLIVWIQKEETNYQTALSYLDNLPKRYTRTPLNAPPPVSVAYTLNEDFGNGVANVLALRLVKEQDWPHWRVAGVLLYLEEQKLPSTTSALLRFAIETKSDEERGYAIETIQAINDPDLQVKISIEKERLDSLQKSLPLELESLVR